MFKLNFLLAKHSINGLNEQIVWNSFYRKDSVKYIAQLNQIIIYSSKDSLFTIKNYSESTEDSCNKVQKAIDPKSSYYKIGQSINQFFLDSILPILPSEPLLIFEKAIITINKQLTILQQKYIRQIYQDPIRINKTSKDDLQIDRRLCVIIFLKGMVQISSNFYHL